MPQITNTEACRRSQIQQMNAHNQNKTTTKILPGPEVNNSDIGVKRVHTCILVGLWKGIQSVHYNDVIMNAMASQITTLAIVFPSVYSRHRSKKISKLRVTGLCEGNLPVTGEFLTQRDCNSENVSIWWRRHVESGLVRRPGSNPSTVPVSEQVVRAIRCNVILRQLSVKRMELWQWNTTASSKHRRIIEEKHVSGAGANDYISQYLWDVITCPRPWYLLLTHNKSSIESLSCMNPHFVRDSDTPYAQRVW